MNIKTIFTIGLFFLLYNFLTFYIGWNGWIWIRVIFQIENSILYPIMIALIAYSYFLGRMMRPLVLLRVIGSYWIGLFHYAVLILPVANIIYWALSLSAFQRESLIFWLGVSVIGILVFIFIYGTFNAYSPVLSKYTISIPKKASRHKHLRVVMVSDLHLGILCGTSQFQKLVTFVNTLNADVILLAGDIIDDDPEPFKQKKMATIMKKIKSRFGVYGVLGNHEFYGKKIPEFLEQMKASKVNMLLDDVVEIDDSFYIVGRKDRTDKNRKSLKELLKNIDKTKPILLMDHQPKELDKADEAGIDLMVSGHTHLGQLFPNHLITRKIFELDYGHLQKNNLHAIVSSGFGFWGPPLRIGSRSEVVQIDVCFE